MIDRRRFFHYLGLGAASLGALPLAAAGGFAKPPPGKPGKPTLADWRRALAAARSREISRLSAYREAGRFPRNHRILGRIPTFVDDRGTPCAVGFLMQRSGHRALVKAIARDDNNVYIENITEGPALDWIQLSGLTQDECARIQPSYDWERPRPGPRPVPVPNERERLIAHFTAVENELHDATDASLDAALEVLAPRIRRGLSLARVVR
jgi:hypothetical protein